MDIEWAEKRLGPQSAKTFVQPVIIENPIPDAIKKVCIQLTDDSPGFVEATERARKNGFQIFSYPEGGHDAMISQPNEIAEMFKSMLK